MKWLYDLLFFLGLVMLPAIGFLLGWAKARRLAFARANWRALAAFAILSWLLWMIGFWVGLNSDWLLTFVFATGGVLGLYFMWRGGLGS